MERRVAALRVAAVPVLQMGLAAGLSWWIAHDLVGHTSTYFAPVAATIVLSNRPGARSRRAVEMVLGIAVGIGIADLLVKVIGTGAIQIGVTVLLAVSAAILLGAGAVIASQAAGTAVLVAAIPAPSAAPTRFIDALIGGLTGLAVLAAFPRNPLSPLRHSVDSFLTRTSSVLADAADALEAGDAAAATASLGRAYEIGRLGSAFSQLTEQGRETALMAPIHWSLLPAVERYAQAAPHVDSVARDARVLCRAVRTTCETGIDPPPQLPAAIRELSRGVGLLPGLLGGGTDDGELVDSTLHAAASATACLDDRQDLAVNLVVGSVRSTAVDILRALGVERLEAAAHVRAAAGDP
jgi:HAMP domain-containing protein